MTYTYIWARDLRLLHVLRFIPDCIIDARVDADLPNRVELAVAATRMAVEERAAKLIHADIVRYVVGMDEHLDSCVRHHFREDGVDVYSAVLRIFGMSSHHLEWLGSDGCVWTAPAPGPVVSRVRGLVETSTKVTA